MKSAIIKVVAVAVMMLSFAFSWVNSPAYAVGTVPTVNNDNFYTEVLKSEKPVIAILVPNELKSLPEVPIEEILSEAQKTFGDGYKIVTGTHNENSIILKQLPFEPTPVVAFIRKGIVNDYSPFFQDPAYAKGIFEILGERWKTANL